MKQDKRNITRIDHCHRNDYGGWSYTRGWWVRFQRLGRDGTKRVVSKLFSDGVHGGKRKALEQAVRWRNRMRKKLPPAQKLAGGARVPPGYGYVTRVERKQRSDWHPHWSAWIRLERGRCAATTASITRWGVVGARLRCEAFLARHRKALRARGVTLPRARRK